MRTSPRYPGSMSPGALTMEMPWRAARPERGSVRAARRARQAEGDAGADDGARRAARARAVLGRVEVVGGVVLVGALGQARRGREQLHRDRERRRQASAPASSARRLGGVRAPLGPVRVPVGARVVRRAVAIVRLEAVARVAPGLGRGQPGLEDHAVGVCSSRTSLAMPRRRCISPAVAVREQQPHRAQRAVEEAARRSRSPSRPDAGAGGDELGLRVERPQPRELALVERGRSC